MPLLSRRADSAPRPARRLIAGAIRLTPLRRWSVYGVTLGIWVTGAVWLILHYFFRQKSEFGFETNPAEPWSLKIHGAFAFASVAMLGLLWGVHVLNGWYSNRRRWSGAVLFGAGCFLVLSGYLLYYAGDDDIRDFVSVAHWAVGLAIAAAFGWHRLSKK
jgi:hypothetical protein